MTIHMDPVDKKDDSRNHYYQLIITMLEKHKDNVSIHDFRRIGNDLYFDMILPFEMTSYDELEERIKAVLPEDVQVHITFELGYSGEADHE